MSRRWLLFPACFDSGYNLIKIFGKVLPALLCIITGSMGITLDEPYRIGRSEIFHKNPESLDPDLIQRLCLHPSSPPSATARDYVPP